MAGYAGPQYQRMCSYEEPARCRDNLARGLALFGGTDADCRIENMTDAPPGQRARGVRCYYQLHWDTYVGWQAYMYCTGCIASDPAHERRTG